MSRRLWQVSCLFQDGFIEKMLAAVNEMEQTHRLTKYLLDLHLPDGLLSLHCEEAPWYKETCRMRARIWKRDLDTLNRLML